MYNIIKNKIFCYIEHNDGFNGHRIKAGISYYNKKYYAVYNFGFITIDKDQIKHWLR